MNRYLLSSTVAAVIAAGTFSACSSPEQPALTHTADAIYFGGDILTMEGDSANYAEAVVVDSGRIVFVGAKAEALNYQGDSTVMHDLKGTTLMPGFIDPHLHPTLAASVLNMPIVAAFPWTTPDGISTPVVGREAYLNALKEVEARITDPAEWMYTWGYHDLYHGALTKQDLDAISTTRPIAVWQRSCHEWYVNSAMLKALDVSKSMAAKNPFTDFDKGHFWETGQYVIGGVVKRLADPAAIAKGLEKMSIVLHKGGLTTIAEQGFPTVSWPLEFPAISAELAKADIPYRFGIVINAMTLMAKNGNDDVRALAEADSLLATVNTPNIFVTKHAKYFNDGSIFGAMAQMSEPYLDGHSGEWMIPPDVQEWIFARFWNAGYSIHVHTNGDRGLDTLLAITERVKAASARKGGRVVVEHFAYARPDQVERCKQLGVVVSNNPYYLYELSAPFAKSVLGPDRAHHISSVGSLHKAGVRTSYHSDYSMAPAEPLLLAWAAVNRVNNEGEVVAPEERVAMYTALQGITIEGAYSLGIENEVGSIAVGKKADFVHLGKNPMTVDPMQLKDIKVLGTVFEGREFDL